MRLFFSLLVFFLTFASAPESRAGRRALLVGVGKYPEPQFQLAAPADDVEQVATLLKTRFGFADREILRLLDAEATTESVKTAFRKHLIEGVGPEDVVVFYFTGHGGFVADLDGDEEDGQDEALCTYDIDGMKPATWLTDDDMRRLLFEVKARQVLVIFDCCHAGTGTRSALAPRKNPQLKAKFMPLEFLSSKDAIALSRSSKMMAADAPANHILLAACDAREEAFELQDEAGRPQSVFTANLVSALSKAPASLTFRELALDVTRDVQSAVREAGAPKSQTPQCEGGSQDARVADYLDGHIPAGILPTTRVSPGQEGVPVAAPPSTGEIRMTLATNGQRFHAGDLLVVSVTPDTDCYLRLYDYNAERQVVQVFPNQYQRNHFVRAGQTVSIPASGAPFRFEMGAPFGNGILKAVASNREFTDDEEANFKKEMFHSLGQVPLGTLGRRGISVVPAAQTPLHHGESQIIYSVEPAR